MLSDDQTNRTESDNNNNNKRYISDVGANSANANSGEVTTGGRTADRRMRGEFVNGPGKCSEDRKEE